MEYERFFLCLPIHLDQSACIGNYQEQRQVNRSGSVDRRFGYYGQDTVVVEIRIANRCWPAGPRTVDCHDYYSAQLNPILVGFNGKSRQPSVTGVAQRTATDSWAISPTDEL